MPPLKRMARFGMLGLTLCAACGGFDKESAAQQIRERFCTDWPYGCTDSTRVEIQKVRKTPNGRSVDFELLDRADESARLSAAYFEPEGDGWLLLLFENPFLGELKERMGLLAEDKREVSERLMELRSAQNWHRTIYGRYAEAFEQLSQVNYVEPEAPIRLSVEPNGTSWGADSDGRYVTCSVGSELLLPECEVQASPNAGREGGVLASEFGEG